MSLVLPAAVGIQVSSSLIPGLDPGASAGQEATIRSYEPASAADFDRLYRDSYGKIVATMMGVLGGNRALSEDCAQEAFAKAFGAWSRWRPEAPAEAWVLRIAVNAAISIRRKETIRQAGELVRRLGRPAAGVDPAEVVSRPLLAALRRLKVEDAALVVFRHHQGYTNREIATALGMPESTIASRLAAAKARLRKILEEGGEDFVKSTPAGVLAQEPSPLLSNDDGR